MTAFNELLTSHPAIALAAGGFIIGILFGALTQRTGFCAMGAVADVVTMGDWRRFRAWLLAAAVAILGTHGLALAGAVELHHSMYLAPRVNWLGHLAGGTLFGAGMVLAGGCASRNLVRAGAGDLRSLITLLVTGLFALVAGGGLLGPIRSAIEETTAITLSAESQSLPDVVGDLIGSSGPASSAFALLIVGALTTFAFTSAPFRATPRSWLSGLGVGLLVVLGWALTGLLFDEMADRIQRPQSLSFVRPTAEAIEWLERATGIGAPGFGAASVFGVLCGSALMSVAGNEFRPATFAGTADTLRHLGGAALMGTGGVMALGCSIGQGVTGISTLALGSFLSFAAIVAGAVLGLKALERWAG
jgi:uncharacterized membrane protein YedE/YeeE